MEVEESVIVLNDLEAVLFDMDGVIIDGMPYHAKAWELTFKEIGLHITPLEVYEREGESGTAAVAAFLEKRGVHMTPEDVERLIERKEKTYKTIADAKPFDGVRPFLHALKEKGKRLALVTGTARHELESSLPEDIKKLFEIIVTGDEVKHGKPNPEPYQKALRQMNLSSEQAVVIENAPLGIQSARAAGLHCLAVETSLSADYLQGAVKCFGDIKQLSAFLLES